MQRIACALFLALAAAGAAAADEPTTYAVQLWAAPTGQGMARTIGPLTQTECAQEMAALKGPNVPASLQVNIPPSLRLMVSQCAFEGSMQTYLAGFHCMAADSRVLSNHGPRREHPDVRLWNYNCFAL